MNWNVRAVLGIGFFGSQLAIACTEGDTSKPSGVGGSHVSGGAGIRSGGGPSNGVWSGGGSAGDPVVVGGEGGDGSMTEASGGASVTGLGGATWISGGATSGGFPGAGGRLSGGSPSSGGAVQNSGGNLAGGASSSSGGADAVGGSGDVYPATFETIGKLVWLECGVSTCHGGGIQPKMRWFSDADNQALYAKLTTWNSPICGGIPLVTPGDPVQSAFLKIIWGDCDDWEDGSPSRMPPGCETDDCLGAERIEAVRQWIVMGAPLP